MTNIFVINNMEAKVIIKNLKYLGLSDNEARVYVSLTELGESSILNITKKSLIPRTTVKSILDRLVEKWYITVHKYNNVNYYWIESPKTLQSSFENKIELTKNLSYLLEDLYRNTENIPYSKVYDTKTSIQKFIEKTVTTIKKWSTIMTIDSPKCKNYNRYFSQEYYENLLSVKKKRDIFTQTLIPHSEYSHVSHELLQKQIIEIREMPSDINFWISLWIIGETMVLFSSSTTFIVEVKNAIITESFRSLLGYIWENSEQKYQPTR